MLDPDAARPKPTFDWVFWVQWVLVSTLGWLFGFMLGRDLGIGAGFGITQWLVLRSRVNQAGWWILASALGWIISLAVVVAVVPSEIAVLAFLLLGALMGTAQWLVLRRWFDRASWWIVISALGWTVGLTRILGVSLVGAVVGAVTGIAMELMMRQREATT